MSYATPADLIARFGVQSLIDLTDRQGVGAMDEEVLILALADAEAVIDGYLAGRYTLPVSTAAAPLLTGYACDLARASLYTDLDLPDTHPVRLRVREARRFLELVGQGKLSLGGAPAPAPNGPVVQTIAGRPSGQRGQRGLGVTRPDHP